MKEHVDEQGRMPTSASSLEALDREKKRYELIQTSASTLTTLGSAGVAAIYAVMLNNPALKLRPLFWSVLLYLATILTGVVVLHRLHYIVKFKLSLDDQTLQNIRVIQFWAFLIGTFILVTFLGYRLFSTS